ncbi:MAG: hypothetical protein JXA96_04845 [Sedimentisphaerales bacterium]|nr:hypothetical protein [Sedimentisphaerales bacterium]
MISGISSGNSLLLTVIWQSTLFLIIGIAISIILRNHSARAHRILLLSIIASVFVPAMTILVKHFDLGIFEAKTETIAVVEEVIEQEPVYETSYKPLLMAPTDMSVQPQFSYVETPLLVEPEEEIVEARTSFNTFVRENWRLILICSWIAISLLLTFRLLVTFLLSIRLLNKAEPLDNERISKALQHAKEKLGIRKDVRLYGSKSIKSPVIWCWRVKPVLLVPKAAGRFHERIDWTGVLCHELAHWKRRDHISGLIAEIAACILPWQIILWLAKSRLINLSEHACDDWVIATGKTGTDYAESLLDMTPGGQMAFVPAVVRDKNGLAKRIHRILKDSCGNPRTGFLWAVMACFIACSIGITVAFAQTRPAKPKPVETNTSYEDKSVTGRDIPVSFEGKYETNRDIPVNLKAGQDGTRKIITTKSIRFDKTSSEVKPYLKIDYRQGKGFIWQATIELLDENNNVIAKEQTKPSGTGITSGQPVVIERQIDFLPFQTDEVSNAKNFRITYEQLEPVYDEIGRPINETRTDWIEGRITDPDGQPIEDAIILINEYKPNANSTRIARIATDEDGRYKFGAVDWPYHIGVEWQRKPEGDNTQYFQTIEFKPILFGQNKVDFKFEWLPFPKGSSSVSGKVTNQSGNALGDYKVSLIFDKDSNDNIKSGDYITYFWINQQINNKDGSFEYDNLPEGKYKIWIIPNDKKGNEWPLKEIELAANKTTETEIEVISKHKLFGRVLFEDGTPAIVKPAPWPGAKTSIVLPVLNTPMSGEIGTIDEEGYFVIYLEQYEFDELKSGTNLIRISLPEKEEHNGKTVGEFPFELLSENKETAGTIKIKRMETSLNEETYQILNMDSLPDGWDLSYDDGIVSEGERYWPANISNDLIQLNFIPAPANEYDESWKDEKLELSLLSKQKEQINTIIISNNQEDNKIVIAPEKYNLIYKRAKRDSGSSSFTPIESVEFPIDLTKSGMYKLKFRPKIESAGTIESGTYPAAVCTGTVIDENGNPIKETQAAAYEAFFDKAGNISMRFVSKITTTDGNFKFEAAPTVTKNRSQGGIIVAEKDGFAIGWAHWPLYGEQNVNITLSKPLKMSGQVLDDNNNPIANAEVRAVLFEDKKSEDEQTKWLPGVGPLNWLTVHTDENGLFEFDNIPDNVRCGFLASANGLGTMYSCEPDGDGGYKNINYAAGTTDIKMILSPEAIIEGKVIDEQTGEALADAVLSIIPHFTGTFFERYLCTTKEDGTFRITGLRNGKYVIRRAGQNANKVDIVAESGKITNDVVIKLPRDIPITETRNDRIRHNENQVNAASKPVNSESKNLFSKDILYAYNLPESWSLNYDKYIASEGTKQGSANMGNNLSSLEILPKPKDEKDESWKNEDFNFRIYSLDGTVMGDITLRPQKPELSDTPKIFQPGRYLLKYERQYGEPGKNYRVNSDSLLLDMSKPGMYQLQFDPKLGNCEISGSAGGCYAVNFELAGAKDFPVRGLAYINREKEYRLDGLPNGTYRLSAVDQQSNGNVVVSQTQVTIENESKVTVDIKPPSQGNCSLSGSILGKQNTYLVGNPKNPIQRKGQWFVLLRYQLTGKVTNTYAYEAITMDSKYVIRGKENIVQETPEKANFKIQGIAPGIYNVTVIENPSYEGAVISRQQSKILTISAGQDIVLDFDLQQTKENADDVNQIDASQNSQSTKEQEKSGEHTEPDNFILIDTQITWASNEFLKEVGLDADSLQTSEKWSKYRVDDHIEPNSFIIDNHRAENLYKAAESRMKSQYDVSLIGFTTKVFNKNGEQLNKPSGDQSFYYNPQLSKDEKSVKLNLALSKDFKSQTQPLMSSMYKNRIGFGLGNSVTVNHVSSPDIFIPGDHTLLILCGKVMAKETKVTPGVPVLKDLPVIGGAFNNTISFDLEIGGQIREAIFYRPGVPVLRDIPLLGDLFDNPSYIRTEMNQLVLVTIHILSKENAEKLMTEKSGQPIILKPYII